MGLDERGKSASCVKMGEIPCFWSGLKFVFFRCLAGKMGFKSLFYVGAAFPKTAFLMPSTAVI